MPASPPAVAAPPDDDGLSGEDACPDGELPLEEPLIEQMLDDDPADSLDVGPCYEPYDDDVAEVVDPEQPEAWDLAEKFVETSILKLNIAMMKSGKRAAEIDARLRAIRGRSDLDTVRRCVAELLEDCQTYLAEQSEAAERFRNRIGELGELKSLGEDIEMANLEQSAQIETTISNLKHMDFESDLEAANQRILGELNHLRVARHKLRDNQETAFLTISRYENRMDKIEKQLGNDPLTKVRNRIGLETTLWHWWQQNRQQAHRMSAAIFDLDGFGKVNEEHGPLVGDRILAHVAELARQQATAADLVGRFAGQQFLAVFADAGPRAAIKTAELVRQTIERTTFTHRGAKFQITATAGILEVAPTETHESFLAKLDAVLKHAKRSGPNRASFHNGREPEPVESPSFGAKYSEVAV
ncbi:MAG: GGDEF domain-containing protein [Pirellulales bacterium]|nr:GGDEF domain-containing protein [Pirellulales bacterium]